MIDGHDILTNSRLNAFQKCRRYHFNRFVLGVTTPPGEALRLGGAVHAAVDCIHSGGTIEEALGIIRDNYDTFIHRIQDADFANVLAIECVKATRLVEAWHAHWSDSHIEFIASEKRFDLPILNPETGRPTPNYRFDGKIDSIVRLEDGRLAIYELKTCSDDISVGSDYWKTLQLDAQISRYMLAARAIGHEVATVLYDVIRKPEISPKQIPELDSLGHKIVIDELGARVFNEKGGPRQSPDASKGWSLVQRRETPTEYSERLRGDIAFRPTFYFNRSEIPRLDHEIEETRQQIWDMQCDINGAIRFNRHYMNAKACRGFGNCEFLETCVNRVDLSGSLPEGFVRLNYLHPELLEDDNGNSLAPSGESSACASAS